MPRYLIERMFPEGFPIASEDGRTSFCLCDAPSPEAVRRAASRNQWPVDAVTQVRVLDPNFHLGAQATRRRRGR